MRARGPGTEARAAGSAPDGWESLPAAGLGAALSSGPEGLASPEAARRLALGGPNAIEPARRRPAIVLFLRQLASPLVLVLLAATAVSASLGQLADAGIVLGIVLGSAVLSFVQEWRAGVAIETLQARLSVRAKVVRDGAPREVPAEEVVPGDVVLLAAGSLVPADGTILDAKDCFVSQAALTGEAFPVEKRAGASPLGAPLAGRVTAAYAGTSVRSGTARLLVARTGAATEFGRVAGRLALRPPEREFERGVRHLGLLLSEATLVLVLVVFALNALSHKPILDALLFSLALAVGLTPQLLPAVVGIALSRGARRMARQGVLVRRLAAIEDFGSMDVLCTDKTGTLTEGVVRLDATLDATGAPSPEVLRLAAVNARWQTGLSSPLDEALVAAAAADGIPTDAEKLGEVPYDFERKRLSVVVRDGDAALLVTKGALVGVLAACDRVAGPDGETPLSPAARAEILARQDEAGARGRRVLGVAVRRLPRGTACRREDEAGMTFAGLLLFLDPPKASARAALDALAALGVSVRVVTGDGLAVAVHTAEALGIDARGAVSGARLAGLSEEALRRVAEGVHVFAEVDPTQKERIIAALRRAGHVVGYMGDGINDAPALHAADVGISVEGAVDVARAAADVVLLEKDLGVLTDGIAGGRATFENTLKYVHMATSANFGNMFSMAVASLFLPFLADAPVTDPAHQLPDRPARDRHLLRPRGRGGPRPPPALGRPPHPPLHARLRVALERLRRPDVPAARGPLARVAGGVPRRVVRRVDLVGGRGRPRAAHAAAGDAEPALARARLGDGGRRRGGRGDPVHAARRGPRPRRPRAGDAPRDRRPGRGLRGERRGGQAAPRPRRAPLTPPARVSGAAARCRRSGRPRPRGPAGCSRGRRGRGRGLPS